MENINYRSPPPHFGRHPDLEPIRSNYKFETDVLNDNANLVYTDQKLFIKMNAMLSMNVSYTPQTANEQMYLRVMILYTSSAEMHMPVTRCNNHRIATPVMDPSDYAKANSIMKVTHPKVKYEGSDSGTTYGERLSIVVPIDQALFDADTNRVTESIRLEFGCQNSCSSGINRRATTMVFTLEDGMGNLAGKAAIQFKVCSCPKRDAERDYPMKKKHGNDAFPKGKRPMFGTPSDLRGKKIKTEPASDGETTAPLYEGSSLTTDVRLKMPTHLVPQLLQQAHQIIASEICASNKRVPKEQYISHLKEIEKLQNDLKRNNWSLLQLGFFGTSRRSIALSQVREEVLCLSLKIGDFQVKQAIHKQFKTIYSNYMRSKSNDQSIIECILRWPNVERKSTNNLFIGAFYANTEFALNMDNWNNKFKDQSFFFAWNAPQLKKIYFLRKFTNDSTICSKCIEIILIFIIILRRDSKITEFRKFQII